MRHSYVVQLLGVGQSQSHIHGVGFTRELEAARRLAIASLIQSCCSSSGLLKIQRTNGDPGCTSVEVSVVSLVDILRKCKGSTFKCHGYFFVIIPSFTVQI